jgi:hypothetical protein
MRITSVRDGDIVEVNDGLLYLARVRGRRGRRLIVEPLSGKFNPAPVRSSEVIAHWRRVRVQSNRRERGSATSLAERSPK